MGQASTKSGVVVWGSTEYGQLGIGSLAANDRICSPRLLDAFRSQSIKFVANGGHHCAAVAENGELYMWGSGSDGELGHGDNKDVLIPKLVRSLQNKIIKCVSCSDRHSAACLADGSVYTWGRAANGTLGYEIANETQNVPKLVESLMGKFIVAVSCGYFHTAFLSVHSTCLLWTCGLGLSGRLGHGDELDKIEPAPIKTLEGLRITSVSCGGHNTACLTDLGELYCWGGNVFGNLGLGTRKSELRPKRVLSSLEGKIVVAVSLGLQHSACVTSDGNLFTWGHAEMLGHEAHGESDALYPRQVILSADVFVLNVSCGQSHTAIVTETGDVWAWGSSRALGHMNNEAVPNTPTCISSLHGKAIVQVSCAISCCIGLSDYRKFTYKVSGCTNKSNLANAKSNNNGQAEFLSSSKDVHSLLSPYADATASVSSLSLSKSFPYFHSSGTVNALTHTNFPPLLENDGAEDRPADEQSAIKAAQVTTEFEEFQHSLENKSPDALNNNLKGENSCCTSRSLTNEVLNYYNISPSSINLLEFLSMELKFYQEQTLLLSKALHDASQKLDATLKGNIAMEHELNAYKKKYENDIGQSTNLRQCSEKLESSSRFHDYYQRRHQATAISRTQSNGGHLLKEASTATINHEAASPCCYNNSNSALAIPLAASSTPKQRSKASTITSCAQGESFLATALPILNNSSTSAGSTPICSLYDTAEDTNYIHAASAHSANGATHDSNTCSSSSRNYY